MARLFTRRRGKARLAWFGFALAALVVALFSTAIDSASVSRPLSSSTCARRDVSG